MTNLAPRGMRPLPWISQFPELNVRTYVRAGGKAGVYFFSLDAASALAVQAARFGLGLPYYSASMIVERSGAEIHYRSHRLPEPSTSDAAIGRVRGDVRASWTNVPASARV